MSVSYEAKSIRSQLTAYVLTPYGGIPVEWDTCPCTSGCAAKRCSGQLKVSKSKMDSAIALLDVYCFCSDDRKKGISIVPRFDRGLKTLIRLKIVDPSTLTSV